MKPKTKYLLPVFLFASALVSCRNPSSSLPSSTQMVEKTYVVILDARGGVMSETTLTVKEGECLTLPLPPTKEGSVFRGWFYDENGNEPFDPNRPIDSDLTLYAVYEVDDVQLILDEESFLSMKRDGHYRLMKNLNFAGKTIVPIGSVEEPFSGIFDGNGFTISDFRIEATTYCSLFGYVTGVIENLHVKTDLSIETEGTAYFSPLVSYLSRGTIRNCDTDGLFSLVSTSRIEGSYFGGIVSRNEYGLIENCFSSVSVSNHSMGSTFTGGIVGYQGSSKDETSVLRNCYFEKGTMQSSVREETASVYLGGVVGYSFGLVEKCFEVTGNLQGRITAYQGFVGGVVGDNNGGTVKDCFSALDLSILSTTGNTFRGAVSGRNFASVRKANSGMMENCFGYEGQKISYQSEENIKARHLLQNAPLLTLSEISTADFYREKLHFDTYLIKDGYYPCYQSNFSKIATELRKGTPGNPILISSLEELRTMKNDQSYRLTCNLSLKDDIWSPIGTYTDPFYGTFDGNHHTISDISVKGKRFNSLFGYVNGIIKNLKTTYTVEEQNETDSLQYYGGIASFVEKSYLENCASVSRISASANGIIAGGIVGYSEESVLKYCYADSTIHIDSKTPSSYAGGLIGIQQSGMVFSCRSNTELTADSENLAVLGGLIGKNEGTVSMTYALGKLIVERGKKAYLGGLIGQNKTGNVSDSYSFLNFEKSEKAEDLFSGGVAGENAGTIFNVYYHNPSVKYSFGSSVVDSDVHVCSEQEIRKLDALLEKGFYYNEKSDLTRLVSERETV